MSLPSTLHSSGLKIDAYLLWALQTGFRYFDTSTSGRTVLLVMFAKALDDSTRTRLQHADLWICPFFDGYSYATVTASIAGLDQQLGQLKSLGALYCELGMPVAPPTSFELTDLPQPMESGPDTVVGIVDDGCPFAHQHYLRPDPAAPRVRYIWDQGGTNPAFGDPPPPFTYGRTYDASLLDQIIADSTSNGVVDEDAAYGLAGLPSLRRPTSHGAQVMSHAAGSARQLTGRAPPNPLSGRTDLAFVQLPPAALDDPTGRWLDGYGLAALQAIRFYAREGHVKPAEKIVVNLSYGPQTGPHDGSAVVEAAIDEMTQAATGYIFQVIVPSGNNHLLRAHAQFDLAQHGGCIEWFVSPDSQLPSFLEIWLPDDVSLDDVELAVDTPGGDHLDVTAPVPQTNTRPEGIAVVEGPEPDKHVHVLLWVAPTARPAFDASAASLVLGTPGRRRVTVKPLGGKVLQGIVHAYLSRSDANMGRSRRGRSGHLESPGYEPDGVKAPDDHLHDQEPLGPAEVVAQGSLNGIGTGARSIVIAGYRHSDRLPAPYSASGPSRGTRTGPNWAYPTEESRVLRGLLAAGNRSATVLRLQGTSFAAPQYARELAATPGAVLPPAPPPNPVPEWLERRAGEGMR
jgi:hypothetical protein